MQFSTKEDIEAPSADVFALLSDFDLFERSAIRRGIEVQRVAEPAAGLAWNTRFLLRGRQREMRLDLVEFDTPNGLQVSARSDGIDGLMTLDLVALSQQRTRMAIVLNLKPKTLSARLLIQSMKLAKANLTKRFKLKVAAYAKSLEDRHRRTA